MRWTNLAAAAVLGAGLGGSCGPGLPPYGRLTQLRVLALRSEIPTPEPGQTTELSALVFTPRPDPSLSYAWSWCPFPGSASQGYPCRVTEAELAQASGAAGVSLPPFDLGREPTVRFTHNIPPAALQAILCRRGPEHAGGQL